MIHVVILAGGSGTRFWPLSRKSRPKQFLRIGGAETLIRATAGRILPVCGLANLYVVAGRELAASVRRHLPDLRRSNLLVEPRPRNTAAAIGLAALEVQERDPGGILVVLPSDHLVRPVSSFRRLIRAACAVAGSGALVTLGVVPTRAETGYGYIQAGRKVHNVRGREVFKVQRFTEKPDHRLAEEYLKDGHYFWNSGMFVFTAEALLSACASHLPVLHAALMKVKEARRNQRSRMLSRVYRQIESTSIDYGIMEKSGNILMLPCDCAWSDVGSFATLLEVQERDSSGNVVDGDVVLLDSQGCVLRSERQLLAGVGLKDMIVVATEDVVMVCPLSEAQKVGRLVEELRRRKREDVL